MKHRTPVRQYRLQYPKKTNDVTEIDGMSQRQKRKLGQQMADMENGFYDGKYIYFELPPVDRKDHNNRSNVPIGSGIWKQFREGDGK